MYSSMLETMWMNVTGNSIIAGLGIIILFAYLSFKQNLGIPEALTVLMPVGIAVSTTGCFGTTGTGCIPTYLTGSIVIGIGILWGMAAIKVLRIQEAYINIYILYLCANAALLMNGYTNPAFVYTTTGDVANVMGTASQTVSTTNLLSLSGVINYAQVLISVITNFFMGGALVGFISNVGLPSFLVPMLAYPIQGASIIIILPVIGSVVRLLGDWKTAAIVLGVIGAGAYIVSVL